MLREPQHERNFPDHFEPPSVRPELYRRTPNEFFQQITSLTYSFDQGCSQQINGVECHPCAVIGPSARHVTCSSQETASISESHVSLAPCQVLNFAPRIRNRVQCYTQIASRCLAHRPRKFISQRHWILQ